jgi:hypothetical protein
MTMFNDKQFSPLRTASSNVFRSLTNHYYKDFFLSLKRASSLAGIECEHKALGATSYQVYVIYLSTKQV